MSWHGINICCVLENRKGGLLSPRKLNQKSVLQVRTEIHMIMQAEFANVNQHVTRHIQA